MRRFLSARIPRPLYDYIHHLTELRHSMLAFRSCGIAVIRRALLGEGAVVFDIGANIGRFSHDVARRVGRSGRVYSFEPMPLALKRLRAMVKLCRLDHIEIIEGALSDQAGQAEMHLPCKDGWRPNSQIAHLRRDGAPVDAAHSRSVPVRLYQLDAFCRERSIERLDLIKCDVEGFEYFVFQGAHDVLSRLQPAVFCEVEHPYLERNGLVPEQIFALFRGHGYRAFLPTEDGGLEAVPGYTRRGNYFFLHPVKHALLVGP